MIRKILLIAALLIFGTSIVFAQKDDDEIQPIKWKAETEKFESRLKKGEKLNVSVTAEIEKGWHLYALEKIEGGPIATKITLLENSFFKAENIIAPAPVEKDDTSFGVVTKFYDDSAKFVIPLTAKENPPDKTAIELKIRFQTCNDQICLPPKTTILKLELKTEK